MTHCTAAAPSAVDRATRCVTAPLALHQAALQQCAALADDGATPAGRKAYRTYADRIAAAAKTQGA